MLILNNYFGLMVNVVLPNASKGNRIGSEAGIAFFGAKVFNHCRGLDSRFSPKRFFVALIRRDLGTFCAAVRVLLRFEAFGGVHAGTLQLAGGRAMKFDLLFSSRVLLSTALQW